MADPIVLATCTAWPDLLASDQRLADALRTAAVTASSPRPARPSRRGLGWSTFAILLSLGALQPPTIHEHADAHPALYNEECPVLQLATASPGFTRTEVDTKPTPLPGTTAAFPPGPPAAPAVSFIRPASRAPPLSA